MSELAPRAWVGCLSCYNDGRLVGQWYEGADIGEVTTETLHEVAANLSIDNSDLMNATHEELWVMDHEGYGGFLKGECSPVTAARIAEQIEAIPDYWPAEAVAAYLDNLGETLKSWADIASDFEDAYCGEYEDEADYAETLAEDIGALREDASWPYSYIDWERAGRDLFFGDNWSAESPKGIYVFRSC